MSANQLFYEDKVDEAIALSKEQLADEWTIADIEQYWHLLGYDLFFIRKIKAALV